MGQGHNTDGSVEELERDSAEPGRVERLERENAELAARVDRLERERSDLLDRLGVIRATASRPPAA